MIRLGNFVGAVLAVAFIAQGLVNAAKRRLR